ncbi:MAG: response regulator [Proteobacteria bacterium]|nr:response regulator [Pseudomonadota bacterium]
MKEKPFVIVDADGIVLQLNQEAVRLLGIPRDDLEGQSLVERVIAEHRIRFSSEIEALIDGTERHGRVNCTVIGLDGIGRRVTMRMNHTDDNSVYAILSLYQGPESTRKAPGSLLIDSGRLLQVAQRISAISRQASNKEDLLSAGLEILAEVTSARAGAALEWRELQGGDSIITVGPFDSQYLRGVFRPAILARLTRGDVVVKEATLDGNESDISLIIVPLLSSTAPVGIIVLLIKGYSVLVPEEQQSLVILGEIIGLGIKSLSGNSQRSRNAPLHRGDTEASIALGRLSAGLAHEINNAATVLRNNFEQLMLRGDEYGHGAIADSAIKDSMNALTVICDLNDALRAFAPEETHLLEEIDLLRVLDMVVRSVRFYAKRGMNVTLDRPSDDIPLVLVRSHYLIRSLFLVFVELVEASLDSGIDLHVNLALKAEDDLVTFTLTVTAGPFSLPTVLLAQLEKGGALTRHVGRAGGELSHAVDHNGNLSMSITLPKVKDPSKSIPSRSTMPPRRGTILIVDDEVAVIRSLRRLLERNHDVLGSRTGEEALDALKSNPGIEIVLYDVSMPRLGGPEFFEELKRLHLPVSDRVVFVTGGVTDAEMSRFLAETPNPVIEKPFDLSLLNDLLASMLG